LEGRGASKERSQKTLRLPWNLIHSSCERNRKKNRKRCLSSVLYSTRKAYLKGCVLEVHQFSSLILILVQKESRKRDKINLFSYGQWWVSLSHHYSSRDYKRLNSSRSCIVKLQSQHTDPGLSGSKATHTHVLRLHHSHSLF
jgi:hypothetical protein